MAAKTRRKPQIYKVKRGTKRRKYKSKVTCYFKYNAGKQKMINPAVSECRHVNVLPIMLIDLSYSTRKGYSFIYNMKILKNSNDIKGMLVTFKIRFG